MNKPLKEIQVDAIKKVKEIHKPVQDVKAEIKAQIDEILEMENLGKRTVTTEESITNKV